MSMPRRTLRRLAVWLVLTLLSAQWAVASYACPSVGARPAAATPHMLCHDDPSQGAPDPAQPLLCKVHCEQGSQTVNDVPAQQPPAQFALWAVLDWRRPALQPVHGADVAVLATPSASPPGSPPLYLRLQVLRN